MYSPCMDSGVAGILSIREWGSSSWVSAWKMGLSLVWQVDYKDRWFSIRMRHQIFLSDLIPIGLNQQFNSTLNLIISSYANDISSFNIGMLFASPWLNVNVKFSFRIIAKRVPRCARASGAAVTKATQNSDLDGSPHLVWLKRRDQPGWRMVKIASEHVAIHLSIRLRVELC
jgi:hypothetical protein